MYYDWGAEHGCGEADCRPSCTRVRALPRVLESRLHGVRAARRREADAAAEAERRHGHGRRAHGRDPAGRQNGLRDRRLPGDHAVDRGRERRRVWRLTGGDKSPPRAGRSRSRHDLSRGGRRVTVERRAGLRHASHHPARGSAGVAHRARAAVPRRPRRRRDRADADAAIPSSRSIATRSTASSRPRRSVSARRSNAASGCSKTSQKRAAATSPAKMPSDCTTPTGFHSS